MMHRKRASRWRRLAALATDYIIVGAVGLLTADIYYEPLAAAGDHARLAGLAIIIIYFGIFGSRIGGGRTMGKRLFGLRVLQTDGHYLSPPSGALRGVIVCLPLFLSGMVLRTDTTALKIAFNLLCISVPAASLYLLIFNKSGRVLHDFIFSTFVEARDATQATPADPLWSGHEVNVFFICAASVLYPLVWQEAPLISDVQHSVESVPEVKAARVLYFRELYRSKPAAGATDYLDIQVYLKGSPTNLPFLGARLENSVFEGREAELSSLPVIIHLHFGATLGVASLSKSPLMITVGPFNFANNVQIRTSLELWREHRAAVQKSIPCADKANPDKVIEGCTFFLSRPNTEPQRRLAAFANRAAAYTTKEEFDRAMDDFDEALKIAPENPGLLAARATLLQEGGEFEEALADLDQAAKFKPDEFGVLFHRGILYFELGQYTKAGTDLHRASAMKDDWYAAIFEFLSSARAGKPQPESLRSYAASNPDRKWPYPVVQFYLGEITADGLHSAAANADENCEAKFYLGQWHFVNGNRAEALPAMRETLAACPKMFVEYAAALAETQRGGEQAESRP